MRILVTGAAGFIGMHLSRLLLERGEEVCGVDNLNDYYSVALKRSRLEVLAPYSAFTFCHAHIDDAASLRQVFVDFRPDAVVHLAAQAGVRYSLENPAAYLDANVIGFLNVLEACRSFPVRHLVYASSSSVYGANAKVPFSVSDRTDEPVSLYAATKKANELMAYTYSHLFGIPATGLRFFTVYGPWGRPDMAYFKFTKAILAGDPIDVYNEGRLERDFTYVDDIVIAVAKVLDRPPQPAAGGVPHQLYNIGNSTPVRLGDFIAALEDVIGRKAVRVMRPMQPGDVPATYADVADLERDVGFRPVTNIHDGLQQFVAWYRSHYDVDV
jgi:UDP-glucuronate 4-epimerase